LGPALQLRRPLAHALPAIRALGDVRAYLGAAVLADDKEVRLADTARIVPSQSRLLDYLGHDLAEVVVGLVDDQLARAAVAPVEDVLDGVELVHRAQVLSVPPHPLEHALSELL